MFSFLWIDPYLTMLGRDWPEMPCDTVFIPAGSDLRGLPTGIQLLGPRGADRRLLQLG